MVVESSVGFSQGFIVGILVKMVRLNTLVTALLSKNQGIHAGLGGLGDASSTSRSRHKILWMCKVSAQGHGSKHLGGLVLADLSQSLPGFLGTCIPPRFGEVAFGSTTTNL